MVLRTKRREHKTAKRRAKLAKFRRKEKDAQKGKETQKSQVKRFEKLTRRANPIRKKWVVQKSQNNENTKRTR